MRLRTDISMLFSCGSAQFKTILEFLEQLEEEMGDLKEKISDYSVASRLHEEQCLEDDLLTANKLNSMNDKVTTKLLLLNIPVIVLQILEIRQLVGVDALSKGKYYYYKYHHSSTTDIQYRSAQL